MEQNIIVTEPARNIRAMARAALKGRWKTALLAYVLYVFLLSAPIILLEGVIGGSGAAADLASPDPARWIVSLYPLIIEGPLILGLFTFFLALARGAECGPGMILGGFNDFLKALGLFLLFSLLFVLWLLPIVVLFGGLIGVMLGGLASTPAFGVMYGRYSAAAVFFVFAAVFVILVVFVLTYAQSFFLLADDPRLGTRALGQSRRMMRGNKWRLFRLTLSFFGWYLPPFILCCVIVALSVMPSPDSAAGIAFLGLPPVASRALSLVMGLFFAPVQVYVTAAQAIFYDILTGRRRILPLNAGFAGEAEAWRPIGEESDKAHGNGEGDL